MFTVILTANVTFFSRLTHLHLNANETSTKYLLAQKDLLTHQSIYVDLNICMAYIIVIFERGVCLLFFSR